MVRVKTKIFLAIGFTVSCSMAMADYLIVKCGNQTEFVCCSSVGGLGQGPSSTTANFSMPDVVGWVYPNNSNCMKSTKCTADDRFCGNQNGVLSCPVEYSSVRNWMEFYKARFGEDFNCNIVNIKN